MIGKAFLGVTLSIAVYGFANAGPSRNANTGQPGDVVVKLSLAASQRTFSPGQPILLKVEAVNISQEVVAVSEVVPWSATRLILVHDGKVIAADPSLAAGYREKFAAQFKLQPGEAYAYRWFGALATSGPQFFYPLAYWGYPQRLPSGHYTIAATPYILSGTHGREWFAASHQKASDSV